MTGHQVELLTDYAHANRQELNKLTRFLDEEIIGGREVNDVTKELTDIDLYIYRELYLSKLEKVAQHLKTWTRLTDE